MKHLFLIMLISSCSIFAKQHPLVEQFSHGTDWQYQDIVVNGETIFHGTAQSCSDRFEVIKPILALYDRPITVFEIGANNGYFCLRIAQEYPSTCVMADTTDRLQQICAANTDLDNIIYLKKRLTLEDLRDLNSREHFDLIIAFHVLHHAGKDGRYKEFCEELFKLGDNIIIETPPKNDIYAKENPTIPVLVDYLTALPIGQQIGSFPRHGPDTMDHMLWFCFKPKEDNLKLYTEDRETGFSFLSFRNHRGRHPSKEAIKEEKAKLPLWKRHIKSLISMEGNQLR
ncbi:class I SAM-dependent methyltransferase [Simkania sp.]|uniref:class I SAM-dependent methyltransferase n=1 Tax=Simkania sp. TaxID=34094 RepID=UPI003B53025C